jgi:hypothetical protein
MSERMTRKTTRPSQTRALWAAIIGVPLLLAVAAALQARRDAQPGRASEQSEELLLRSPTAIKRMSLGYDSLLADVYWTRAVQYYGQRAIVSGANFDQLWPLLDISTTLDPKLIVAYRFGAVFLSQPKVSPGEIGTVGGPGRTDLAVELVKRGVAANPDSWILYSDLGFLYYWRLKDYPAASAAYLAGSKLPDAPSYMKMMAARVAEKGGSIETSRMIWSQVYTSTTNLTIRSEALRMLRVLKAQDDEEHLDALAQDYRTRFGRFPASIGDLQQAGFLHGTPVDPAGYPYVLGADGKSKLSPESTIVITPQAPQTTGAPAGQSPSHSPPPSESLQPSRSLQSQELPANPTAGANQKSK